MDKVCDEVRWLYRMKQFYEWTVNRWFLTHSVILLCWVKAVTDPFRSIWEYPITLFDIILRSYLSTLIDGFCEFKISILSGITNFG